MTRALAGMRFTSARVMAPVQGGRVRLSIRVRVPGGAAAQSTRTLVFVLRAEPEGWRAASVRPVRVVRGSSGG